MYREEELTTIAGYECLKTISPQTKRVLRKLRKAGVIVFQHDDGLALITRDQLIDTADAIGLNCYPTPYEVVLIDTDIIKPIDGATDVRNDDYPEFEYQS